MSKVFEFLKAKADLSGDGNVDAADLKLAIALAQTDAEKLNKAATPLGAVLIAATVGVVLGVLGHMVWVWSLQLRIFA
jgi:hypothetical protein